MGKTLTGILEIAAAIAVQFIPGLGTVAGIALGLSLAASGFITLLTKTPKPPAMEGTQKIGIPPRISAYGIVRSYGYYILFQASTDDHAVDVWVYHDGQIDSIVQYYIGDKRVTVSGGWVQQYDDDSGLFGKDGDIVQAGSTLGLPTETAFAAVIAEMPGLWTDQHRGDGCVTGYMISRAVKSKNYSTIYATGGPNQTPMSLAFRAQLVFDWRDSSQIVTDPTTWKFSENAILHLAHYLLVRMGRAWDRYFLPTIDYWTAAADDADIPVPLTGVQTILVAKGSKDDTSVYLADATGLHVGITISIFVSGDNSQTETREITELDGIQAHFSGGLSNLHPLGSQVTWVSDPANPATEPRYRSCVSHQHTDAHKDVLAHLIACSDAWLAPRSDGAFVVYSGRYVAPTGDPLGSDEIISFSLQDSVKQEEAINNIKVSYISANHDYNTVQTDDWSDEDDIETRGQILSDSLDNQTPSYSQNRRLAKRALSRLLAPYRGTILANADARRFIGQRYIDVDLTEAGYTFYAGPIEVQKMTRILTTGGFNITFIVADPNIDAWDPATEQGNPAPVGNRVSASPVTTPSVLSAVFFSDDNSGAGTAGARIRITAQGPSRDDLTWYARWRVVGSVSWNEQSYTDVDAGDAVVLETGFVPVGSSIEVEVAYQQGNGQFSDYSSPPTPVSTTTLTADDTTDTADSGNITADRI